MTLHVHIKLFASLNKYEPGDSDRFPVAPETTVFQLLGDIGAPREEAKLIFINNRRKDISTILKDGDRVGIFPPLGGG